MSEALINPRVLSWARKRARLDRSQVAKAMKATDSQIAGWEAGDSRPAMGKALDLARVLKVPFGFLFLSSPPSLESQIPDLRTVGDTERNDLSVNFRDALQSAILKQQWFREYREQKEPDKLSFVGKFTQDSNPADVANSICESLDIGEQMRGESRSAQDYLRLIVLNAEKAGVLVLRSGVVGASNTRTLSVKEFRGFVLSDSVAPLVFLNANDAKTAQVFTLIHELAHIWIGTSGISNPETVVVSGKGPRVELFCNEVSARVLTPEVKFRSLWRTTANPRLVANTFRVSQQVVVRRAFSLSLINEMRFHELMESIPNFPTKKTASGGDFHKTLRARNSVRFTNTLLGELRSGNIGYRDAARLLNIKPATCHKLEARRSAH
jgi:Zn-dependent peptidase ImmA (M78 family)/DNA-binding XRE family transcriptional regulator